MSRTRTAEGQIPSLSLPACGVVLLVLALPCQRLSTVVTCRRKREDAKGKANRRRGDMKAYIFGGGMQEGARYPGEASTCVAGARIPHEGEAEAVRAGDKDKMAAARHPS